MHQKYFIAIVPPEPILSEVKKIKQSIFESHGIKGALRSPAHITLHMPFTWDDEKEEKLINSLQTFHFENAVNITLKNVGCFQPRVIFISVIENQILNALQKQLVTHCKKQLQLFNQADDRRGFHPHVTIAFRDLKKQQFYILWETFKDKDFDASFKVNSFYLMKQIDDKWEAYTEIDFMK